MGGVDYGFQFLSLFPPPPTHIQAHLKHEGLKRNATDAQGISVKKAHSDSDSYSSVFLYLRRQVHAETNLFI